MSIQTEHELVRCLHDKDRTIDDFAESNRQLREELEQAKQDHAMCVTRWREALENPIPAEGTMPEPAESLYRRTERLRTALAAAKEALRQIATHSQPATIIARDALARIAECEKGT